MDKIRIGIVGYGNIGRGVEKAIARNEDMELTAVFTRRDPSGVKIATEGVEVKHIDDMLSMKDKIDVMMLCGGSATDLCGLGSGNVLVKPPVCRVHPGTGKHLYILGKGRKPGAF